MSAPNIGTLADVWAQDLLQITFSAPMKNDEFLQDTAAYLVSPIDGGIPVTVLAVQTGSEVGPVVIYIVITEPTIGKTYTITFQSLYNITGQIVDPIVCKFIARPTKQDAIIRSRPDLYDMTPDSLLRKVMSAIGRQDDLIGGSRNDQFFVGALVDPPLPQIDSFVDLVPVGFQTTITGLYFTGTTSVFFGLIAAVYTVVDDHHIIATVPVGTIVAPIIITTPAGFTASTNFTP
jgi:hypothetical protein